MPEPGLHLFEGFGIELEYMIVRRDGLDVSPVCGEVLRQIGGEYAMEVELGEIAWSNELALHVIELKTNGPAKTLIGLERDFQANVEHVNRLLGPMDARLMPTAMHPWMVPERELVLWPHENDVIYKTFDRIFGCRGHGWANLQSAHINLPFADDREFGKLHAAIRLVLPIVSGLAASSPIMEGELTGLMDTRLEIYRHNSRRVPEVAGIVVPERVFTRRDYEDGLLASIYRALAPHDPEGVLRHEWVNARGCIARFDRFAIEIRLVDVQEHPGADIAVAAAIAAAVRCLTEEAWCSSASQRDWHERELAAMLEAGLRDADDAVIDNTRFLECFGFPERGRARMRELWQHLVETVLGLDPGYESWHTPLGIIRERGCLARRIAGAVGTRPTREDLRAVYARLCDCLARGEAFAP